MWTVHDRIWLIVDSSCSLFLLYYYFYAIFVHIVDHVNVHITFWWHTGSLSCKSINEWYVSFIIQAENRRDEKKANQNEKCSFAKKIYIIVELVSSIALAAPFIFWKSFSDREPHESKLFGVCEPKKKRQERNKKDIECSIRHIYFNSFSFFFLSHFFFFLLVGIHGSVSYFLSTRANEWLLTMFKVSLRFDSVCSFIFVVIQDEGKEITQIWCK